MALISSHLTMPLPLTELASSIQNQVPQLLERTFRHTVESSVLENQCANLKVRIEEVKGRITEEREEQEVLREKIVALRAFSESRLFNDLGKLPSSSLRFPVAPQKRFTCTSFP